MNFNYDKLNHLKARYAGTGAAEEMLGIANRFFELFNARVLEWNGRNSKQPFDYNGEQFELVAKDVAKITFKGHSEFYVNGTVGFLKELWTHGDKLKKWYDADVRRKILKSPQGYRSPGT